MGVGVPIERAGEAERLLGVVYLSLFTMHFLQLH